MLGLVAALALAAAPAPEHRTAVLVVRRTNVSASEAMAIARQVSALAAASQVPPSLDANAASLALSKAGVKDSASCAGRRACLAEVARVLGVSYFHALSLSRLGTDTSVVLELLDTSTWEAPVKDSVILGRGEQLTGALLAGFLEKVHVHLAPPEPPRSAGPAPADAPRAEVSEPPPLAPPPLAAPAATLAGPLAPEPPRRARVAPFVLGGAAIAALGAGVALLAVGLSARAESIRTVGIDEATQQPLSAWTEPEARARAQTAGVSLAVAGGLGAAAVGLTIGAIATW